MLDEDQTYVSYYKSPYHTNLKHAFVKLILTVGKPDFDRFIVRLPSEIVMLGREKAVNEKASLDQ